MKRIEFFYNEKANAIDILQLDSNHLIRINCGEWECGLRTTPNSQGRMDALALDNPEEYVRLMLSGEMQVWLDAWDDCSVW